jgi:hypothetical protein
MLRAFYRLPVGYHFATVAAFGLTLDYCAFQAIVAAARFVRHLFAA